MVVLNNVSGQLPLIHFVESDDLYFQDQPGLIPKRGTLLALKNSEFSR